MNYEFYLKENNLIKISNIGYTVYVQLNSGWHTRKFFKDYEHFWKWYSKETDYKADIQFKDHGNWIQNSELIRNERIKQGVKDIGKHSRIFIEESDIADSIKIKSEKKYKCDITIIHNSERKGVELWRSF